ncbi:23S rRNA pseudouridine(955/2504/2580) synthase RluC [Oceanisphaera avium]|uniref:Pseudouridine synthase n=1 Tax=Oceanisphaera avium TaxID=1903694 RepID=A0A1Y0CVK2_9GAMM|nr:23S rRNA pseudouridine(955/2504/2580) synthase RluC [Oceanisphaera avium]ART79363.1 23S rRNA pseudouridine(955/2504/2580) synthase [Oceanisphaera avium]
MKPEQQHSVQLLTIDDEYQGQRIDNFLRTQLKGVPKTLIYRIVRKGEVRVNKKRIKPEYKLQAGDVVRIPPVRVAERAAPVPANKLDEVQPLEAAILYEDEALLIINKPAGMAVHGGSGLSYGLIEGLRALRPEARFLELVHRLDRDTSGLLLVAKKRSMLRNLHEQLREKTVEKHYFALVAGHWPAKQRAIKAPLRKIELPSGDRVVSVDTREGKASDTRFRIVQQYEQATLLDCSPITGRTHQIRVHTLAGGHPIAGDNKYGDQEFDSQMRQLGLTRLFLHACRLRFFHPVTQEQMTIEAPLEPSLETLLTKLKKR